MAAAGLSGRIARAVAWSGLNTLLTRLITIAVGAIAVRLMSHHDFGSYSVALAVYLVISGFSEFGLSAALARADLDPDEIGPSVSLLSILVSLVTSGGLALAAHPIAVALGAPDATGPLRVLALCLLLTGVLTVPTGLLIREFRQEAFLVANLVCFVPSNALLIFLASRGDGALAFAWSRVADSAITGVVLLAFAKKLYRPRVHRDVAGSVLRFGVPVAGANLVRFVLLNADYLFISRLMGPAALGIYTLAFNVSSWASSVLGGIIFGVAMPAISHDKGDPVRLRSSLRHSVALVSLVAFPLVAVSIGLAHPLVGFIYGPRWGASAAILEILGVYGALFVLALLLGNVLTGLGLSGRLFTLQIVWLAALIPAMAIGVHLDGLKGAALAHVATMILIVIPAHLLALRRQVHGVAAIVTSAAALPLAISATAGLAAHLAYPYATGAFWQCALGGVVALAAYLVLGLPLLRIYLPAAVLRRVGGPLRRYDAVVSRLPIPDGLRRSLVPAPRESDGEDLTEPRSAL